MKIEDLHLCDDEHCLARKLHYDNCPKCFGFGMEPHSKYQKELVPVAVWYARNEPPANPAPCPFCGSTLAGAPTRPATHQ